MNNIFLKANWPPLKKVKTLITTRKGGISTYPYDTLNLSLSNNDDKKAVLANRIILQNQVNKPIIYLNQIHSNKCITTNDAIQNNIYDADAIIDTTNEYALSILTADCLPIRMCDINETKIAAIHAGWKGLANKIIDNTLNKFNVNSKDILIYLGPCISQKAFEIEEDVIKVFLANYHNLDLTDCITKKNSIKYLLDLPKTAAKILNSYHITNIYYSNYCTYYDNNLFYSYRKNNKTGRFASIIWLE